MRWPKGLATVEDGWIRLVHVQEEYNPFDHYHPEPGGSPASLYLEFASLDDQDKDQVAAFVTKYGLLGLEARQLQQRVEEAYDRRIRELEDERWTYAARGAYYHSLINRPDAPQEELSDAKRFFAAMEESLENPSVNFETEDQAARSQLARAVQALSARTAATPRDTGPRYGGQERLEEFQEAAGHMRRVLTFWKAYKQGDTDALRSAMESGGTTTLATSQAEVRAAAARLLSLWMNQQLVPRVWPRLTFDGGNPVHTWGARDLLAAMYVMVYLDIAGPFPPIQCANVTCRRFFIPSRAKNTYCSEDCSAAQRMRRHRQSERDQ